MIPLIGFIGWHNSGKTTLIRHILSQFTAEQKRVGVIKSSSRKNLLSDKPDSDTHLFTQAGASATCLTTPDQCIIRLPGQQNDPGVLAERFYSDMDIVIVEGFKRFDNLPKIEVHRQGTEFIYPQVKNVIALVSDSSPSGIRVFSRDEIHEIYLFLHEYFFSR